MIEKLLFIAADPGGMDVILPVYDVLKYNNLFRCNLFLTGASGDIETKYKMSKEDILAAIDSMKRGHESFILITGTSVPTGIELDAINSCRQANIQTICILDYWSNYLKRFISKDTEIILPDHLFVMDDIAKIEAIKEGIQESIIEIVGQPGLDRYIEKQKMIDLPDSKKLCFLSQPLSVIYGDKLGFNELKVIPDVLKVAERLGFDVRIKFHPREAKCVKDKFGEYATNESIEEIAYNYSYVIGMSTMAMLKIIIMGGARVFCYEPDLIGEDFCICNKLGLTRRIDSINCLASTLSSAELQCEQLMDRLIWMDGKSTLRCVNRIMEITNTANRTK